MKIQAAQRIRSAKDPQDVLCFDVPLFIRMLELARESLETDEQLHVVVDRVIAQSKTTEVMTMKNYPEIWPE